MKGVWPGLFAGAALAGVLCACAQSGRAPMSAAAYEARDLRKDEIRDLWMQIREWRVEEGWTADPLPVVIRMSLHVPVADLRLCPGDPTPKTELCTDVCTVKDAICDNAESICRIAADLGGDPWADDKCESAKGSCREARDQCCRCVSEEVPAADLDADAATTAD